MRSSRGPEVGHQDRYPKDGLLLVTFYLVINTCNTDMYTLVGVALSCTLSVLLVTLPKGVHSGGPIQGFMGDNGEVHG